MADSQNKLQTVKGDFSDYNTTLLSIDASGNGVVHTNVNKGLPAEFESIVINDTRILLLSKVADRLKTDVALQALDKDDFRTLDGKNAVGMPQGAKGGWVGSIGRFGTMAGSDWSDMRFGVYVDEKNVSHLFVHGKPGSVRETASGVVAYTGSAIIGKDGNYRALPNSVNGVVDWNNKLVSLNITDNGNQIKVGGNIKGNTFEGLNDGVQTRGAFYGSSELGGMFNATSGQYNGYNGVFGATKGRVVSP